MDSYSNEWSSKSGVASFHEFAAEGRFFQWLELTQRHQLRVFRRQSCATAVVRFGASESHLQGVFPRKRCARCASAQLRDGRLGSLTRAGSSSLGQVSRRAPAGHGSRRIPGRASAASAPVRCAALGFNGSRAPSGTRHDGVRGTAHLISDDGARRRYLRFRSSLHIFFEVHACLCGRAYTV